MIRLKNIPQGTVLGGGILADSVQPQILNTHNRISMESTSPIKYTGGVFSERLKVPKNRPLNIEELISSHILNA